MTELKNRIGFIGAGNMGEAICGAMIKSGIIDSPMIHTYDVNNERLEYLKQTYNISISHDIRELFSLCDVVILAVKPQTMDGVLKELAPEANPLGAAPEGIKPEWYLLAPYQALKLFPGHLELIGMAIMGLAPLVVIALPFVDKEVPTGKRGELITKMAIGGLIGFLGMTIWGLLS